MAHTQPKYDQHGRPTDGSSQNWAVHRPHGRGTSLYETEAEAEADVRAAELPTQHNEVVWVWRRVSEFETEHKPVIKKDLTRPVAAGRATRVR